LCGVGGAGGRKGDGSDGTRLLEAEDGFYAEMGGGVDNHSKEKHLLESRKEELEGRGPFPFRSGVGDHKKATLMRQPGGGKKGVGGVRGCAIEEEIG